MLEILVPNTQFDNKKHPTVGPILLSTKKNVSHHRKIQFNDHVEQCIAVDNEDNIDDDEMNIPPPKTKRKDYSTICKLAPTKLKEDRKPLFSSSLVT